MIEDKLPASASVEWCEEVAGICQEDAGKKRDAPTNSHRRAIGKHRRVVQVAVSSKRLVVVTLRLCVEDGSLPAERGTVRKVTPDPSDGVEQANAKPKLL
jgi:hypothetical protein